jgi:hypothetical protein
MILNLIFVIASAAIGQTFGDRLGIEIDGFGDSSRSRPFVDHARVHRPCTRLDSGDLAPRDADGWPMSDAQCVMFDVRAIPAWAPPIDDPAQYQPDWSGEWQLALEGEAEIGVPSGGASVQSVKFDPETNTTTARVVVPQGSALLILSFRRTRRTADAQPGSGFRSLRMIRPGYADRPNQVFTDEFLESFQPFRTLRYMDFLDTNGSTPSANPTVKMEWSSRHVPSDATQQRLGTKAGVAWEFAALLANQTGTHLWINIPVAASDSYVRSLAEFLRDRLNPSLKIYLEHGNEVWNPLFANSYNFNRNSAQAEVSAGGSNLNSDGVTDLATLAVRRHLRRVIECTMIFDAALGGGTINQRLFAVFAWWTIRPEQYRNALTWARSQYGDLDRILYALAQTHYYNVARAPAGATPEELVAAMRASSDSGQQFDDQLRRIAADFGLRHAIYEGGPDVGGGSTVNVGNRILANRLPQMKPLVRYDMVTNWLDKGGAEYMYFAHCNACSRYGCYGAAEDIAKLDTPKFEALRELAQPESPVSVSAVDIVPGKISSITGTKLASAEFRWEEASLDGQTLPRQLGGVWVLVNGRRAEILSVSPEEIRFVAPGDLTHGPAQVVLGTKNGFWPGESRTRQ